MMGGMTMMTRSNEHMIYMRKWMMMTSRLSLMSRPGSVVQVKCVAWSPGGEFLATCSRYPGCPDIVNHGILWYTRKT